MWTLENIQNTTETVTTVTQAQNQIVALEAKTPGWPVQDTEFVFLQTFLYWFEYMFGIIIMLKELSKDSQDLIPLAKTICFYLKYPGNEF